MESFLHYLYYDNVDPRSSPQHVVAVLHVAHYYGAAHLVGLCEAILAKVLKKGDKDDEGKHLPFLISKIATIWILLVNCKVLHKTRGRVHRTQSKTEAYLI